jgi:hypothetical protein
MFFASGKQPILPAGRLERMKPANASGLHFQKFHKII